jgi:uncharacterized peroxidase-related enzyme
MTSASVTGAAMSWIATIPPDQATGTLREAYATQESRLGHGSELTRLGSLYPDLVAARLRLYDVVEATPSAIPDWTRRAIALTVSGLNGCRFCTAGNRDKLLALGHGALADAVAEDPAGASTGDAPADALLGYARRLTTDPAAVSPEDLDALRHHGWDDLDILDVNDLVAYYGYINRVAAGLGLNEVG